MMACHFVVCSDVILEVIHRASWDSVAASEAGSPCAAVACSTPRGWHKFFLLRGTTQPACLKSTVKPTPGVRFESACAIFDVRTKLAEVLSSIRRLQASESDLIYGAYQVDLGGGD